MPQAKSPDAYPGARQLLDRALESPKGISVTLTSAPAAFRLQMNCYTVRSREVERSTKIYESTHPQHGRSPYDTLSIYRTTPEGKSVPSRDNTLGRVLIISKETLDDYEIQDL